MRNDRVRILQTLKIALREEGIFEEGGGGGWGMNSGPFKINMTDGQWMHKYKGTIISFFCQIFKYFLAEFNNR